VSDLLDRDIPEGQHFGALHKPGRTVHVPDPGVCHRHLVVHVSALGPDLEIHRVAEVEPALGLDGIREDADDVFVLAVELELLVALVLLDFFSALCETTLTVRDTLTKRIRWVAEGPCTSSRS
jgi:hypothetical protein